MVLEEAINKIPNFFYYLLNFFELTNEEILIFSIQIIILAIMIFILAVIIFFIFNKKSREQKEAANLLKKVEAIRKKGDLQNTNKEDKLKNEIKKESSNKDEKISLKNILIKKFGPKIEDQLQTKIEIIDLISKGENFEVLANINETKLTLIIDNSGKIIDYKKEE